MVSLTPLLLVLTFPLLLLFFLRKHRTTINKPSLPPGPRGLPIVGNLHQLNSSALYLNLWQLTEKYGPLFSLRLGLRPALVVSSPKIAQEVLKYDIEFSDRPSLLGQQKLSYNGLDIGFSPYNDYWREIRKICVVHIFSSRRVSKFSCVRQYEVRQMMRKISGHAASLKVTNLNETLMSLTSTIICRVAFGKRYEEEGVERSRFHGLLKELQAMMGSFFFTNYIPFLGWIDRFRGLIGRVKRNFNELDAFYQEVIDDHLDPKRQKPAVEDIIDVLLHLKKQRWFSIDLTFDHIKAILMDILVAAKDTSVVASIWAMTELVKNPRVMQKVQAEVRKLYGTKDFIDEDDIQKLPYLKAVIKESLRLHPPAPLLLPRETNKKCIIDGYEIPAKILVFVNAWAIQRDLEAWKDPEKFYPKRFVDSVLNFKRQHFELIPFGAGRRMCPG